MAGKWEKTKFPGVRYREHANRRNGIKLDQYFVIFYRLNGKRKEEAIGWATKGWTAKKANAILSELLENQRKGSGPQTLKEKRLNEQERRDAEKKKFQEQEKANISFATFFQDKYLPANSHKKAFTMKGEEGQYKNWIKAEIGHLPFNKITGFNIEKIKKNMTDAELSPRSIQYCYAIIRQVWNLARQNGITPLPCPKIKIPKFDNKRLRFFTHEEADNLLDELSNRSEQLYDMALLSLHTGARAGEIFSLTWGAVNLTEGIATAKDSKSGKNRPLYLTRDTKEMLEKRFQEQGPEDLIFPDKKGNRIKSISNAFERAVNKLGMNNGVTDRRDKATFHTLRHTFASWHVQNGTDLYTVKELLGHSTIALTERYSHLKPEGLKQTAELFNQILNIGKKGNTKAI